MAGGAVWDWYYYGLGCSKFVDSAQLSWRVFVFQIDDRMWVQLNILLHMVSNLDREASTFLYLHVFSCHGNRFQSCGGNLLSQQAVINYQSSLNQLNSMIQIDQPNSMIFFFIFASEWSPVTKQSNCIQIGVAIGWCTWSTYTDIHRDRESNFRS